MTIENMTNDDYKRALLEIQELENTGILPQGIVREIASGFHGLQKGDFGFAIKIICRKSLSLYVESMG